MKFPPYLTVMVSGAVVMILEIVGSSLRNLARLVLLSIDPMKFMELFGERFTSAS